MTTLDFIKNKMKTLYETNPNIHISISTSHPRISVKNDPVKITGVYKNVFRVEEYSSGTPRNHTLQYTDILTKQVVIDEIQFNV
ncbi:MAG: hypothetical protein E7516_09575 [Ruminococcaceae bacterium]|nr:hypothetical protein [Oscillospiraceae bacterium]